MPRANKRSGPPTQFPVRLHDMMTFVDTQPGLGSVIGWVLGGRGFMIHDPNKLVDILPLFFGQTKYKSFLRQLNMWDFDRIAHGPNKGTYMHPYFVKGNRGLCGQMSRQIKEKIPRAPPRRRQISAGSSDGELGSFKSNTRQCCSRMNSKDLPSPNRLESSTTRIEGSTDKKNPEGGECDILVESKDDFSVLSSRLLKASSQYETVLDSLIEPFPSRQLPIIAQGGNEYCSSTNKVIKQIGEIMREYSYLFDKKDSSSKMPIPCATSFLNDDEAQASTNVLGYGDDLQSCFAGKTFFLVDDDAR